MGSAESTPAERHKSVVQELERVYCNLEDVYGAFEIDNDDMQQSFGDRMNRLHSSIEFVTTLASGRLAESLSDHDDVSSLSAFVYETWKLEAAALLRDMVEAQQEYLAGGGSSNADNGDDPESHRARRQIP